MIHRYVERDKRQAWSQETLYQVLRCGVVTEKSTLCQQKNCYVFDVAPWANKMNIKQAVELIFDVKVSAVNTLNRKGKTRSFRGTIGQHSAVKKALVSLQKGHSIDLEKGIVS